MKHENLKNLPAVIIFFLGFLGFLGIRLIYGIIPLLIFKYAVNLNWILSIATAFMLSFFLEYLKYKWDERHDQIRHERFMADEAKQTPTSSGSSVTGDASEATIESEDLPAD